MGLCGRDRDRDGSWGHAERAGTIEQVVQERGWAVIHNIIPKGSIAASSSETNVLTDQDINGLIVSAAGASTLSWNASDFLTVSLKSPYHTTEVLVNRVSLIALAGISDHENGMSIGLQDAIAGVTTTDFTSIALGVPLGCLKMRPTDSKLEVTIESGATKTYSVAGYFNDDDTDHMVKTLETSVLKDTEGDVDKIYLFKSSDVTDWSAESLNILITGDQGSYLCNAMDAFGYTAVMGEIEAEAPRRIVKIFDNADGVHDNVDFQITGTTTNYKIITRSVIRDRQRVSRGTIATADRLLSKQGKWEASKVSTYKRAGVIPSLSELRSVRKIMNPGKPSLV